MVVLSRQQLFTESTITVVQPLLADFSRDNLLRTARLWSAVLCANIFGTFLAAVFCSFSPVMSPALHGAMLQVAADAMAHDWGGMLFRGVAAGFLIAAMVWLIPSSKGSEFHVVTLMTYLVAIGGFAHIVAGSMESFMLVLAGQVSFGQTVWGFMVPAVTGNMIGGTALFALISYAQVMQEM